MTQPQTVEQRIKALKAELASAESPKEIKRIRAQISQAASDLRYLNGRRGFNFHDLIIGITRCGGGQA